MKKFLALTIAVIMTFTLCACAEEKEEKVPGELTVLTEVPFEPFEFYDENNEFAGFDVDLMEAIAEDQGYKLNWKDVEYDILLDELNAGTGDVVIAGMNKLSENRASKADFGDTYFESAFKLMVNKDSDIKGLSEVTPDMVIACLEGSSPHDYTKKLFEAGKISHYLSYSSWHVCFSALASGDVDAVIIDKPVGEAYTAAHSDRVKMVGKTLGNHEEYGFAVAKGNTDLLDSLDEGFRNIKANGTYDKLISKWFE